MRAALKDKHKNTCPLCEGKKKIKKLYFPLDFCDTIQYIINMLNNKTKEEKMKVGDTITTKDFSRTAPINKIEDGIVTIDYSGSDNSIPMSLLQAHIDAGEFFLNVEDKNE
jgi:hypothetical protein